MSRNNLSTHLPPAKQKSSHGFSLIELSIVLVVIGLIIGGVLVGKDLIENSKVRAQLSQIEQLNTAVNTFKLKYGYIPGDLPNAISFGLGTTTNHNGNGDGFIDYNCFTASFDVTAPYQYNKEAFALPVHLAAAGLIPSGGYPGYSGEAHGTWILNNSNHANKFIRSSYSPNIAIMPSRFRSSISCGPLNASFSTEIREGGNGWFFTAMPNSAGGLYISTTLQHSMMYQIDSKIDDGLINSGKISVSHNSWNSTVHALASTSTFWVSTPVYLTTSSTLLKPVIINQF